MKAHVRKNVIHWNKQMEALALRLAAKSSDPATAAAHARDARRHAENIKELSNG